MTFSVFRYAPERGQRPRMQTYRVDTASCGPMILDALIKIKNEQDSTLTFRRSCREGICGSCAMNVNGENCLACLRSIDSCAQPGGSVEVQPLPGLFVLRDLVPDMTNFYEQYKTVQPWLKRKTPKVGDAEFLQSKEDRAKLDGMYEVGCSVAYRWIADSRDEYTVERMVDVNDTMKLYRCHGILNCSRACPKGLDPAGAIRKLKAEVEAASDDSRFALFRVQRAQAGRPWPRPSSRSATPSSCRATPLNFKPKQHIFYTSRGSSYPRVERLRDLLVDAARLHAVLLRDGAVVDGLALPLHPGALLALLPRAALLRDRRRLHVRQKVRVVAHDAARELHALRPQLVDGRVLGQRGAVGGARRRLAAHAGPLVVGRVEEVVGAEEVGGHVGDGAAAARGVEHLRGVGERRVLGLARRAVLGRLRVPAALVGGLHRLDVALDHLVDVDEDAPLLVHREQAGVEGEGAVVHERLRQNAEVVLDELQGRPALVGREPGEVDVQRARLRRRQVALQDAGLLQRGRSRRRRRRHLPDLGHDKVAQVPHARPRVAVVGHVAHPAAPLVVTAPEVAAPLLEAPRPPAPGLHRNRELVRRRRRRQLVEAVIVVLLPLVVHEVVDDVLVPVLLRSLALLQRLTQVDLVQAAQGVGGPLALAVVGGLVVLQQRRAHPVLALGEQLVELLRVQVPRGAQLLLEDAPQVLRRLPDAVVGRVEEKGVEENLAEVALEGEGVRVLPQVQPLRDGVEVHRRVDHLGVVGHPVRHRVHRVPEPLVVVHVLDRLQHAVGRVLPAVLGELGQAPAQYRHRPVELQRPLLVAARGLPLH
ncbi:iron-sulfur subunit of succinate dehydrogenase [Babesia caballi]|uniref:Iron-sulfur subunit of succinate dehydrogenase n=1 Tax=Babesia caballi TaxID=5871 RepID=A0AAV4M236_BABCB|nr:iron-sulfur subunit of succinate dehydrogenase [Babesia caballi]